METITSHYKSKVDFYSNTELVENERHIAGFKGTFDITDHNLIPEVLMGYLQRHFGVLKLRKVPLDEINEALNNVWDGPGSVGKVIQLEKEMLEADKPVVISLRDLIDLKKLPEDEAEEEVEIEFVFEDDTEE